MLEVIKISKYFGGLSALRNVSFTIKEKELVSLIGPYGAGKTITLKTIQEYLDQSLEE